MRRIAGAVLIAAVLAACGGAGSPARKLAQLPAAAAAQPSTCISTRGYGGLGARATDFDANNDDSTGPAGPTPGAALYEVMATKGGCVTAFAVQDSATPPLRAGDMVAMVSRGYLPSDARRVARSGDCAVWRSRALQRAVGWLYARAAGMAQAGAAAGSGLIEATSDSSCH